MKYKIGNKVKVKSLKWYNENKDDDGSIYCCGIRFIPFMSMLCNCILTIKTIDQGFIMLKKILGLGLKICLKDLQKIQYNQ